MGEQQTLVAVVLSVRRQQCEGLSEVLEEVDEVRGPGRVSLPCQPPLWGPRVMGGSQASVLLPTFKLRL